MPYNIRIFLDRIDRINRILGGASFIVVAVFRENGINVLSVEFWVKRYMSVS